MKTSQEEEQLLQDKKEENQEERNVFLYQTKQNWKENL